MHWLGLTSSDEGIGMANADLQKQMHRCHRETIERESRRCLMLHLLHTARVCVGHEMLLDCWLFCCAPSPTPCLLKTNSIFWHVPCHAMPCQAMPGRVFSPSLSLSLPPHTILDRRINKTHRRRRLRLPSLVSAPTTWRADLTGGGLTEEEGPFNKVAVGRLVPMLSPP